MCQLWELQLYLTGFDRTRVAGPACHRLRTGGTVVCRKGVGQCPGATVFSFIAVQVLLYGRIADKVEFNQHRRHLGEHQHIKTAWHYTFVASAGTSGGAVQLIGSHLRKIHTAREILVQFQHYQLFGCQSIHILVGFHVAVFELDYRVLALHHLKISFRLVCTENIHRRAGHGSGTFFVTHGIAVY